MLPCGFTNVSGFSSFFSWLQGVLVGPRDPLFCYRGPNGGLCPPVRLYLYLWTRENWLTHLFPAWQIIYLPKPNPKLRKTMIPIFDGNSRKKGSRLFSKIGNLICLRLSLDQQQSLFWNLCMEWSELPSLISTMRKTISFSYNNSNVGKI